MNVIKRTIKPDWSRLQMKTNGLDLRLQFISKTYKLWVIKYNWIKISI